MAFSSIPWRSLRSAPAQNALSPDPVSTIARTLGSATAERANCPMPRSVSRESAFIRSGRSMVMIAVFSRCVNVTSAFDISKSFRRSGLLSTTLSLRLVRGRRNQRFEAFDLERKVGLFGAELFELVAELGFAFPRARAELV